MRTESGMTLRRREMNTLEQMSTMAAAKPMPMAVDTEVVVARVGQVPSTSTSTGFSFKMPLKTKERFLFSFI